jgi:hypothetical protein
MQYYNNTLAIEASWLIDEGIISPNNYKQLCARKQLLVVRRGCLNTPALVAYDSMPERFKSAVRERVGDPYKVVLINQIEERIQPNAEASDFYDDYRLTDGRYLPNEKRREYYANAIVLNAIHELINSRRAKRSALGGKTTRFWEKIAEDVQTLDRTKYPHELPVNARRLEDKYKKYRKEGYTSLIHKNFLNSNAAKVADGENTDLLLMLISDPRNLDNAQVMRLYNMVAEQMKWDKITATTVANHRDKNEHITYARRRGATAFRNEKTMQVKRIAPTCPLLYWTMDGWDVELLYQQTENARTTYHHRPTVVVVLDACLKYPIGYAIGTHETPELIQEALRNAAKHTESLFGQMYRTNQLQSDHYAIKKLTPTYEGVAAKVTPARVKNAKAKIIEPYFREINKKYCQLQKNWSGFGVTANKDNQPNVEYLNKFRKDFPDFEGVCKQVISMIEAERAEKRAQYVALFDALPDERKIPLSYDSYLMLFGARTGNKNLLQGSGLKITIGGQKRDYDCFDHDFRKYASTRWEVRFDPEDLTRVLAVNDDESLRFVLEEKYVQPMALAERKEGDSEQLQRVVDFNNQLEQYVAMRLGEAQATTTALLENNREMLEASTLQKLLIVDSTGQHKNRRNDSRSTRKAIKETAVPAEVFEVTEENYTDLY